MNYITYNYALDALVAAMDKKIDVQEAPKTFQRSIKPIKFYFEKLRKEE